MIDFVLTCYARSSSRFLIRHFLRKTLARRSKVLGTQRVGGRSPTAPGGTLIAHLTGHNNLVHAAPTYYGYAVPSHVELNKVRMLGTTGRLDRLTILVDAALQYMYKK
jgi:hypothetical protein